MSMCASQMNYLLQQCVTSRKTYLHRCAMLHRQLTLRYPEKVFTAADIDALLDQLGTGDERGLNRHLDGIMRGAA